MSLGLLGRAYRPFVPEWDTAAATTKVLVCLLVLGLFRMSRQVGWRKSCLLVDLMKHKFRLLMRCHYDVVILESFWSIYCSQITEKSPCFGFIPMSESLSSHNEQVSECWCLRRQGLHAQNMHGRQDAGRATELLMDTFSNVVLKWQKCKLLSCSLLYCHASFILLGCLQLLLILLSVFVGCVWNEFLKVFPLCYGAELPS